MIRRRTPLKRSRIKRKPRPTKVGACKPDARKYRNVDARGLAFLVWLKTLPCVCCHVGLYWKWIVGRFEHQWTDILLAGLRQFPETQAAHIGGGLAAKASNWRAIPLCARHHNSDDPTCEHKLKKRFAEYWRIPFPQLMACLRDQFDVLNPEQT